MSPRNHTDAHTTNLTGNVNIQIRPNGKFYETRTGKEITLRAVIATARVRREALAKQKKENAPLRKREALLKKKAKMDAELAKLNDELGEELEV